ncbi:hypothetical protein AVEN_164483-1 [Araneus ventricosus]|uniref:Integrase zinc-binding domain-containing protein n=1 Tax=Araneus ventricosus TaxID=182803 RepID=A0A4Y2IS71_ARAVE|nr:hypothetical protein AVEN_164483-1 [Araneus ventricosus]
MKYEAAKTASKISMHARAIMIEDNSGKQIDDEFESLLRALENLFGSSCRWQLILPKSKIQGVLQQTRDTASRGHFGVMRTFRKDTECFYWNNSKPSSRNCAESLQSPKKTQNRTGKVSD